MNSIQMHKVVTKPVKYFQGFYLTPDRQADEEHISLPRQGNVRIEALFKNDCPNL